MRFFVLSIMMCCIIILRTYSIATGAELTIGFDRDFAPLSFEDGRGEPTGFDIDLLRSIFYKSSYTVKFKPLTWEMLQIGLSEGTIQIAPGFIKTPITEKLFQFTERPYYHAVFRMFTDVKDRVPNAEWLRGKFIGVKRFSFAEKLLLELKDMRIKSFTTDIEALRALYDEQVSGYLGIYNVGRWYIRKALFEGIVASGSPIAVKDVYFGVNIRSKKVLPFLNAGLERIRKNGEYDRLYRKWFVEELTEKQEKELIDAGKEVANYALTQYSKKPIGGALLTQSNKIYTGVAVESMESKDSISAIKSAMAEAGKNIDTEVHALVLVNPEGVLAEPSESDIRFLSSYGEGILVLMPTATGTVETLTIGQILSRWKYMLPNVTLKK